MVVKIFIIFLQSAALIKISLSNTDINNNLKCNALKTPCKCLNMNLKNEFCIANFFTNNEINYINI